MNIQNIRTSRSVERTEMSGSITFADKITVLPDQIIQASVGYGEELNLKLMGQVTKAETSGQANNFSSHVTVTALSLFKNFMKHRISTDWLESMNGQEVLELLVSEFMSWNKFDFVNCAGTHFRRIRVDDMLLPDAIQQIAEACLCEIYFDGDGTIRAVPFPIDDENIEYKTSDVFSFHKGSGLDIGTVNTIQAYGRQYEPGLDDVPLTPCGEETFQWSSLRPIRVLWDGVWTEWAQVAVPLYKTPILKPRMEITAESLSNTATYTVSSFDDNNVYIDVVRNPASELPPPDFGFPDFSFTVNIYGYLFHDREKNRIHDRYESHLLLKKYNGIRMETEYENPFVQTKIALGKVAEFVFQKGYREAFTFRSEVIHNPILQPNAFVLIPHLVGNKVYVNRCIVRTIETSWEAGSYKLTDTLQGWYIDIDEFEVEGTGQEIKDVTDEYSPSEYSGHPEIFDYKGRETIKRESQLTKTDGKIVTNNAGARVDIFLF